MSVKGTRVILYTFLAVICITLVMIRVLKIHEEILIFIGVGTIVTFFGVRQWKYRCPVCDKVLPVNLFRKSCSHCSSLIK